MQTCSKPCHAATMLPRAPDENSAREAERKTDLWRGSAVLVSNKSTSTDLTRS